MGLISSARPKILSITACCCCCCSGRRVRIQETMDTKTREESVDWKCKNITIKIKIVAACTENNNANIETVVARTETRKLGFVNYDWKPYFKTILYRMNSWRYGSKEPYTPWIHESKEPYTRWIQNSWKQRAESMKIGSRPPFENKLTSALHFKTNLTSQDHIDPHKPLPKQKNQTINQKYDDFNLPNQGQISKFGDFKWIWFPKTSESSQMKVRLVYPPIFYFGLKSKINYFLNKIGTNYMKMVFNKKFALLKCKNPQISPLGYNLPLKFTMVSLPTRIGSEESLW